VIVVPAGPAVRETYSPSRPLRARRAGWASSPEIDRRRRKGRCERAGLGRPPRPCSIAGVSSAGLRRPPVPCAGPGGPPRWRSIVGTENPLRARAPGLRGGGESPAQNKLRQARRPPRPGNRALPAGLRAGDRLPAQRKPRRARRASAAGLGYRRSEYTGKYNAEK
jgi:hypothetical protein